MLAAGLTASDLTPLDEDWSPDPARPRVFKSTGMAWEDAVLAGALVGRFETRAENP